MWGFEVRDRRGLSPGMQVAMLMNHPKLVLLALPGVPVAVWMAQHRAPYGWIYLASKYDFENGVWRTAVVLKTKTSQQTNLYPQVKKK